MNLKLESGVVSDEESSSGDGASTDSGETDESARPCSVSTAVDLAIDRSILNVLKKCLLGCSQAALDEQAAAIRQDLALTEPLSSIARGGMGTVYRSTYRGEFGIHRAVAVKVMLLQKAKQGDRRDLERFRLCATSEASFLFELRHPNIVKGYKQAVVLHPKHRQPIAYFLGMEFMLLSLYDLLQVWFLDFNWTLRNMKPLLVQLSHALAYLLGLSIAHHDVKTDNVLVDYPEDLPFGEALARGLVVIKLGDFNCARAYDVPSTVDATVKIRGRPRGTEPFMPPELRAIINDPQSAERNVNPFLHDSYSLGLVFVSVLLGWGTVLGALNCGKNMRKFWNSQYDTVCRAANEGVIRDENGRLASSAWSVLKAFNAIRDLLQEDVNRRQIVDLSFVHRFYDL